MLFFLLSFFFMNKFFLYNKLAFCRSIKNTYQRRRGIRSNLRHINIQTRHQKVQSRHMLRHSDTGHYNMHFDLQENQK